MVYGNPSYNNSIFTADLDKDGTIYSIGTGRERIKVGVDAEKEQEYLRTISDMQEPLDNYYQKLIEIRQYLIDRYDDRDMVSQLAAFAPRKSPEEIAQETAQEQMRLAQEQAAQQAKINQALLEAINHSNETITQLSEQVKELRANGNGGYVVESGDEQNGRDSESDGSEPKPSKSGAPARAKNVAGNNEKRNNARSGSKNT